MQTIRKHDLVHIHALFSFASTAAAWVARGKGIPYVVRPLGTLTTYALSARRRRLKQLSMMLVEGQILRRAAAVHFTSRIELEEAEELGIAMRGVVIPLGVERDEAPHVTRMVHSALDGRRVILFLSRLDPKKNLEAVIDAVALSELLRNRSALLIAGTGDPSYVERLKKRVAAAGLSDCTVWLDHVEGAQKRSAFATADVFVLPSFSENFGIAAAEAMLAGLPCILGQGVAIAPEVEQAGGGLAITPDPVTIASALEHLLTNEVVRRDMGARAAQFANSEYSTQAMTRRLIALYELVRSTNECFTLGARG
jgi:glycosyltransferase involved in cell wall biosynthesis